MIVTSDGVLEFWFEGDSTISREKWFRKDPAFDAACATFTDVVLAARRGELDVWSSNPRGALALVLLLDQLPRNTFRDSDEAFASDPHARFIADQAIARGFDAAMTPRERMFLYLPFEHSEDLADQDRSVILFETLRDMLRAETIDYAVRHRDVIRRFGRFPHRNAVLGRTSTVEELAYLAEPGAGF